MTSAPQLGTAVRAWKYLQRSSDRRVMNRSPFTAMSLFAPLMLASGSWIAGGVPMMTDAAAVIFFMLMIFIIIREVMLFRYRFGIGALTVASGFILWVLMDYFRDWFGYQEGMYQTATLAKALTFNIVLAMGMLFGLLIKWGDWFEKLMRSIPEPASQNTYFYLAVAGFLFGLLPYFLFSNDAPHTAIINELLGRRQSWTVGRTGNLNYSFGGYAAQILDVGAMASLVGVTYALLCRGSPLAKLMCWAMWLFWLSQRFNSGRRGEVVFMIGPVIAILVIKQFALAAAQLKRVPLRSFLIVGGLLFMALLLIQLQSVNRNKNMRRLNINAADVVNLQGNSMFTESLLAFELIPSVNGYFANRVPGEGAVRTIPTVVMQFLIHPIPRAIWKNKPIDGAWSWYNNIVTGEDNLQGTTIAPGLAGWFYMRFGLAGVIQGGILWGWILRRAERVLLYANGSVIQILLALCVTVWAFRCWRSVSFIEIYPVIIGAVFIWFLAQFTSKTEIGQAFHNRA